MELAIIVNDPSPLVVVPPHHQADFLEALILAILVRCFFMLNQKLVQLFHLTTHGLNEEVRKSAIELDGVVV